MRNSDFHNIYYFKIAYNEFSHRLRPATGLPEESNGEQHHIAAWRRWGSQAKAESLNCESFFMLCTCNGASLLAGGTSDDTNFSSIPIRGSTDICKSPDFHGGNEPW